ncbi:8369_t:CDS:1 [Scutellospora calospora]|uniref:8369_t:CDS:1 n=1 Tax=Scutellospora calospora TaxID=85575 RepID=A0ACA9JZG7_9GLOM|nr:8369_t:CDS:1 [Scutellospora calospora]
MSLDKTLSNKKSNFEEFLDKKTFLEYQRFKENNYFKNEKMNNNFYKKSDKNWPNDLEKEFGNPTLKENNQIKLSLSDLNHKIEQDLNEMNKETFDVLRNNQENINQNYFQIENNENKQYFLIKDDNDLKKFHSFSIFAENTYITFNFIKEKKFKLEIHRVVEVVDLDGTRDYEEIIKFIIFKN